MQLIDDKNNTIVVNIDEVYEDIIYFNLGFSIALIYLSEEKQKEIFNLFLKNRKEYSDYNEDEILEIHHYINAFNINNETYFYISEYMFNDDVIDTFQENLNDVLSIVHKVNIDEYERIIAF